MRLAEPAPFRHAARLAAYAGCVVGSVLWIEVTPRAAVELVFTVDEYVHDARHGLIRKLTRAPRESVAFALKRAIWIRSVRQQEVHHLGLPRNPLIPTRSGVNNCEGGAGAGSPKIS